MIPMWTLHLLLTLVGLERALPMKGNYADFVKTFAALHDYGTVTVVECEGGGRHNNER